MQFVKKYFTFKTVQLTLCHMCAGLNDTHTATTLIFTFVFHNYLLANTHATIKNNAKGDKLTTYFAEISS